MLLAGAAPLRAQHTSFGAGVYLFHQRPFGEKAAEPHTEVYAAFVTADAAGSSWKVHGELRARDTRLRAFFPGNVWVQEAWASYDLIPRADEPAALKLRAGKIYQTLGRFWDGSFFGNVHYFDGLKLNPQFGVEATGAQPLGSVVLGYTAQFLLDSDKVSGALPGRDFETLEDFRNRDGAFGRVTIALPVGVTLGGSAAARGVAVPTGGGEELFHQPHLGADIELERGFFTGYVEWLKRGDGDLPGSQAALQAGSDAIYWLAGAQLRRGRLRLRYNYSRVAYDALDRDEWIHQPGIGYDIAPVVYALFEVDLWRLHDPVADGWLDRSLNFVLLLRF